MDCKDKNIDSIVMAGDHVDNEAADEDDDDELTAAEDFAKCDMQIMPLE